MLFVAIEYPKTTESKGLVVYGPPLSAIEAVRVSLMVSSVCRSSRTDQPQRAHILFFDPNEWAMDVWITAVRFVCIYMYRTLPARWCCTEAQQKDEIILDGMQNLYIYWTSGLHALHDDPAGCCHALQGGQVRKDSDIEQSERRDEKRRESQRIAAQRGCRCDQQLTLRLGLASRGEGANERVSG